LQATTSNSQRRRKASVAKVSRQGVADTLGDVRKVWAGLFVIVVAAVVVSALGVAWTGKFDAWGWVFRSEGTVGQLADWVEHDEPTCEVTVESVHLPMPKYFKAAQRGFTDAPSEVKYVKCEHLGGSLF
jgi:hypothetical protein